MNNVSYNDKQNWVLNEIVYPEDTNRWEKGIADVVALANYINDTELPGIKSSISTIEGNRAKTDLSNLIAAAAQKLVPVGALMMSPTNSLDGYLLCNGQAVSRTTYATLFAKIGVNFGIGDGINTFNVPDYRGCFLRGLGGDSAADMYTKQAMAAPNITGNFYAPGDYIFNERHFTGAFKAGPNVSRRDSTIADVQTYPSVDFDASASNSVYGAANEIRPVNYAINYFIKY